MSAHYDLWDVLPCARHLPGKHDQKSHGRGGGSGGEPGGKTLDQDSAVRAIAGSLGVPSPGSADGFADDDRQDAKRLASQSVAARMSSSTEAMLAERADIHRGRVAQMTEHDPMDEAVAVARQPDDTLAYSTVIVARLPTGELEVTDVGTGYDIASIVGKADPLRADVARLADADGFVDFGDGTRWALGGTQAAESLARESMASDLIDQWAKTSNDGSPRSHAIQEAAREEFGLADAAQWNARGGQWDPAVEEGHAIYSRHAAVYRDFVRAQYQGTQEWLQAHGVDSVTVWRGVKNSRGDRPVGDDLDVQTRPLSSWSYDQSAAAAFAGSDDGVVMRADVPSRQVLSMGMAGVGCLSEGEVVLLGGTVQHVKAEHRKQW